jgi:catechol 2,3-dioxygenase-like lactoylglutathione lyase family enzyme
MTNSNSILLYVTDAPTSARFYTKLLGLEPVEASPTFVMFILPSGIGLGLWGKDGVAPTPCSAGGGCDLGFKVEGAHVVDTTYADWVNKGATIILPPANLDFGRTFVATDPDGHRLRVYALAEEA